MWLDAQITDADNVARAVTVSGLLPASRYRARVRCPVFNADGSFEVWPDWAASPISDWYMTLRKSLASSRACVVGTGTRVLVFPSCVEFNLCVVIAAEAPDAAVTVAATSWEKRAILVQWKVPRINGALVTRFRLEHMRLRPRTDEDSDSASHSSDSDAIERHVKVHVPVMGSVVLEDDLGLIAIKKAAAEIATRRARAEEKRAGAERALPVYNQWLHVCDADIVPAGELGAQVTIQEDEALSKLQGLSADEFPRKMLQVVRRDGFGATLRFQRIADVLHQGAALTLSTLEVQREEPDAAWLVRDIQPGSHHVFRISCMNERGWGPWSDASPPMRANGACIHPLRH